MQISKFEQLAIKFKQALANDNLEECFKMLSNEFVLVNKQKDELVLLERRFSQAAKERRLNKMDFDEFAKHISQIASNLLELFNELDENSLSHSSSVHDKILIVACKKSPTNWERLFPDAYFSHVHIMRYGDEIPASYQSADVVIFDDLDCPGIGDVAQMRMISRQIPGAYLLYYGPSNENPVKDSNIEEEKAIYARMTNANSVFTIHARLRELLEFRKIYGAI
jgi:hypothetical protein